jgi:aerobic-type carbon monoxide dehydrogenase small subunit (CoxS/CutS family)
MKQLVKLKINGLEQEVAVQTHHTLLEVLRQEFRVAASECVGLAPYWSKANPSAHA